METEQIQGSKAYAPSKHSGTQSWDVIPAALTDPSVIHGIFLAVLTVPTVILVTFLAAHRSNGQLDLVLFLGLVLSASICNRLAQLDRLPVSLTRTTK